MVLEFDPSVFPYTLLKKGLTGQIAYFFIMFVLAAIVLLLVGMFIFPVDLLTILVISFFSAVIVTRSGIDKLKKTK